MDSFVLDEDRKILHLVPRILFRKKKKIIIT